MRTRSAYIVVGLFIAAAVDFLINLLASAVTQQPLGAQLSSPSSIGLLVALIVLGLLLGYWLSGDPHLPPAVIQSITLANPQTVSVTRLRALLSYGKLRGMGISLSDILLIGSRLDIDTKG